MKLISFTHDGAHSFGLVEGSGVIDVGVRTKGRLADLTGALGQPDSLEGFAAKGPDLALADVTLLPPIPDSRRIMCVGLNYKTHIAETGREVPKYPMLFPRYPDSLVGAGQPMLRPHASERFDFEGELAFVIGTSRPSARLSTWPAIPA